MTDLKNLLDRAAGPDPAVTDSDLSADLRRARRTLVRRRRAGAAAVAVTTVAAIGAAYLVAPGPAVTGGTDAPVASATSATAAPSKPSVADIKRSAATQRPRAGQSDPELPSRPPMVWADEPVKLVPNTTVPRGATITCDLMPEGWEALLPEPTMTGEEPMTNYIWVRDPKSDYPSVEPPGYHDGWGRADGNAVFYGPFGDKVGNGWAAQVTGVVDGKQYAMFTDQGNTNEGRPGEVFVRLSTSVTIQAEIGPRTGWDSLTAARWAASCHPVG